MATTNGKAYTPGRVSETRFALLENEVRGIKDDVASLRADLQGYFRSRPRITQWVPAIIAVGGLFWFFLQLYFGNANQTTREALIAVQASDRIHSEQIGRVIEITAQHTAQNSQSLQDRNDMRAALVKLTDIVADLGKAHATEHSERLANEREIETQFDADSQLRNVQWATMQRRLNDFQNTFHDLGAKWPAASDGPYVTPNISNRAKNPIGGAAP